MVSTVGFLLPWKIWQDMSLTPSLLPVPPAIPDMPLPLLFSAPMMPATCVPCPGAPSPCEIASMLPEFLMKLNPFLSSMNPFPSSSTPLSPFFSASLTHMQSLRSSWIVLIPLSIIATMMSGLPAQMAHASFTAMSAPATAVEAILPSLCRFHCSSKNGSSNEVPPFPLRVITPSYGIISDLSCFTSVLNWIFLTASSSASLSAASEAVRFSSKVTLYHLCRLCLTADSVVAFLKTGSKDRL